MQLQKAKESIVESLFIFINLFASLHTTFYVCIFKIFFVFDCLYKSFEIYYENINIVTNIADCIGIGMVVIC